MKSHIIDPSKDALRDQYATIKWGVLFVWVLLVFSNMAYATTYYNATKNGGGWTWYTNPVGVVNTSTPTRNVDGAFNFASTNGGITKALTAVNSSSYVAMYNIGAGTATNTITGGVISTNGSLVNMSNYGSGTVTNTITGGVTSTNSGSFVNMFNYGSGTVTNTITGGVTISAEGNADFSNRASGTVNSIIDTITINDDESWLFLGGGGSTTHINTLNWNNGKILFVYNNGSFGNTAINTLNLGAGPLTLELSKAAEYNPLTSAGFATTLPLFTVTGAVTGDPSKIVVSNNSPFSEVIATSGAPNGITVSPDGTVMVTLVPTATSAATNHIDALGAANDLLPSLQNTASQMTNDFAPSQYKIAKAQANITKIMRENRRDSLESLITALAKEDTGTVTKIRGDYRIFAAPYVTQIRNNGMGGYQAGFGEKYYGLLMGGSHYFKSNGVNLLGMIGFGASKIQMDRSCNSNTNGKNLMLGMNLRKTFIEALDFESNLSGITVKNVQQRQGNPSPSQSYIALSRYNVYALSFKNEIGYIFKLPHGFSIKPATGLQLNLSKRTKIQEQNAGIFAQNYRASISRDGEVYGGMGVRHQWKDKDKGFEGKITLKYEVGQKSGNGKSSSTIYTEARPGGTQSTGTKPGSFTHYINLYGSLLDMKSNWKVVPGLTATFQKGQKSLSGTVKLEHRF